MNAEDEARLRTIEARQRDYLAYKVTLGAYDIPWLIAKVRELDAKVADLEPSTETEETA